jgi:hypothetical protein
MILFGFELPVPNGGATLFSAQSRFPAVGL